MTHLDAKKWRRMNAQGEAGERRKKRLVIIPSCVVAAAAEELVPLPLCEVLGRRRRGCWGRGIPALRGETVWFKPSPLATQ